MDASSPLTTPPAEVCAEAAAPAPVRKAWKDKSVQTAANRNDPHSHAHWMNRPAGMQHNSESVLLVGCVPNVVYLCRYLDNLVPRCCRLCFLPSTGSVCTVASWKAPYSCETRKCSSCGINWYGPPPILSVSCWWYSVILTVAWCVTVCQARSVKAARRRHCQPKRKVSYSQHSRSVCDIICRLPFREKEGQSRECVHGPPDWNCCHVTTTCAEVDKSVRRVAGTFARSRG